MGQARGPRRPLSANGAHFRVAIEGKELARFRRREAPHFAWFLETSVPERHDGPSAGHTLPEILSVCGVTSSYKAARKVLKSAKGRVYRAALQERNSAMKSGAGVPFCACSSRAQRGAGFRAAIEERNRKFMRREAPRFARFLKSRWPYPNGLPSGSPEPQP